jgi:hypothetical protein
MMHVGLTQFNVLGVNSDNMSLLGRYWQSSYNLIMLHYMYNMFEQCSLDHHVKFGSIDSHSPMRGHMGHPEASQLDLENQPVL